MIAASDESAFAADASAALRRNYDQYPTWKYETQSVTRAPLRKTPAHTTNRRYWIIECLYCEASIYVPNMRVSTKRRAIESHLTRCEECPQAMRQAKRFRGAKREPKKGAAVAAVVPPSPVPAPTATPAPSAPVLQTGCALEEMHRVMRVIEGRLSALEAVIAPRIDPVH